MIVDIRLSPRRHLAKPFPSEPPLTGRCRGVQSCRACKAPPSGRSRRKNLMQKLEDARDALRGSEGLKSDTQTRLTMPNPVPPMNTPIPTMHLLQNGPLGVKGPSLADDLQGHRSCVQVRRCCFRDCHPREDGMLGTRLRGATSRSKALGSGPFLLSVKAFPSLSKTTPNIMSLCLCLQSLASIETTQGVPSRKHRPTPAPHPNTAFKIAAARGAL